MSQPFEMTGWVHTTNVYEVNVRQYTAEGTFLAFAKHLPRLQDMGVETLWFMPIYPIGKDRRLGSMGSYYSISDYRTTNPEFGSLDDFRELVQQAHAHGFKVILDWVANHTSWDHVWTRSHPDFFLRTHEGHFQSPYDWHDVIQIDHSNTSQQDEMIASMAFWVREFHIDGFRCDMAHLVPFHFWERARQQLDAIRPLYWLAETEDYHYLDVFDSIYTWEFLHKMEAYWKKQTDMDGLLEVLEKYKDHYATDRARAFFTSNHDENSHSGSEYERMGDGAMAFAVLCATWGGLPLVYSGQELPCKKRIKFFDKDPIEWQEPVQLHSFYKSLLWLHREHPAMRAADADTAAVRVSTNLDQAIFAYQRIKEEREVLVLLNLSPDHAHFKIHWGQVSGFFRDLFTGQSRSLDDSLEFELPAWAFRVLVK